MKTKLQAILLSCLVLLAAGVNLEAQNPNQPPPPKFVPSDTAVVALYEGDYQVLLKAFSEAPRSRGIQDGAVEDLRVVRLKAKDASKLMLTIFNALQGTTYDPASKPFGQKPVR